MNARVAPVRVSFVIGSLRLGGAERQLVRLVNGLDRTRFTPSIVCLEAGGELEDALAPDVSVFTANLKDITHRRSRVIRAARIMARLIGGLRAQRPNIVHGYLPTAYVLGGLAAWLLRVQLIVAGRRGLTSFEIRPIAPWKVLGRLANHVIDVHVCNSLAVRNWVIAKEAIPIEKTRVVHNGIDVLPVDAAQRLPPEWESVGVKAAMLANLIRYKGHREVLNAVARVAKAHPSFRLVLLGDGPQRETLMQLVQDLEIVDNVIFAGRRIDAAQLVQAFDFTILGSSAESFPNALMESMAGGVPVVSTSVGGVSELLEDGVQGRLVPFGDLEAMAAAITWMIEHPQERRLMGERARRRIGDEFSTERMIEATQAIYEELRGRARHDLYPAP